MASCHWNLTSRPSYGGVLKGVARPLLKVFFDIVEACSKRAIRLSDVFFSLGFLGLGKYIMCRKKRDVHCANVFDA